MSQDKRDCRNTFSFQTKLLFALWSLLLSIVIRYPYLATGDSFPLGDGGLFAAMINAIKANHYLLPETVSYNNIEIPFAYPPLGFYLTIFVAKITGTSTLWTMRFLPIAFNFFTIVSVVFLASEFIKNRVELLLATTIFPIIFQSYEWLIKGGGITRSPSLFFMTLTLLFLVLYQKHGNRYHLFFVVGFLSAAIMAHAEWGLIAVVSIFAYLLTHDLHNWRGHVRLLAIVGISSMMLTSPWWLTVISRFGITPFLTASQSVVSPSFFSRLFDGSIFSVTVTLYDDYLIPTLAATGIIVSLLRRDFFFPTWLLSIYIVNSRNTPKNEVIPLAFLAAIGLHGIDQFLSFLLTSLHKKDDQSFISRWSTAKFSLSYVYIFVLFFVLLTRWEYKPLIRPISQGDRIAMNFIKEFTPTDANFVVLTPYDWFAADNAEWFPYLSDRHSLTTPQGLEWVSSREFKKLSSVMFEASTLIQNELTGSNYQITVCQYIESHFSDFDYVVIFVRNTPSDFGGFLESGRYKIFYQKKDVLIYSTVGKP
jgi:hypothetical protein